jgi:hypothetical protein
VTTRLVTVEFVPGFEGIGERVTTDDGYKRGGWRYQCDGMPSLAGCHSEIVVPRRYVRFGIKPSGWWVTWGEDEDWKPDKDLVLTFCPRCTAIIRGEKIPVR